jgi:hypothetical protein
MKDWKIGGLENSLEHLPISRVVLFKLKNRRSRAFSSIVSQKIWNLFRVNLFMIIRNPASSQI